MLKLNIMKKILLAFTLFISFSNFGQDCTDLFISEYVEGWSNNKALEIYNPTNQTIDLSDYMVIRYSNGATSASSANAIQLTGTIAAYDVHVGVLEKLDPNGTGQEAPIWDSLQARADAYYCPDYNTSNAWYFNGNDAVVLAKGSVNDITNAMVVDVFGKIGEDPGDGWTSDFPYVGAGQLVTKDHSMLRKSTILKGEVNPVISFFDPLLEYDSIPAVVVRLDENGDTLFSTNGNPLLDGNWSSLGTHDCECNPVSITEITENSILVYPNPSTGTFSLFNISAIEYIEITNAVGKKVYGNSNTKQKKTIEFKEGKGLYFIRLLDVNGNLTIRKIIVK
jgi:hypothetical protein